MRVCQAPNGCSNPVYGSDKTTGIGYCKFHQHLRKDLDRRSIMQKAVEKINSKNKSIRTLVSSPENKLVMNNAVLELSELEKWYDDFAILISFNPYCIECNTFIPKKFYRAASAHIFPKRDIYGFPSIKTHELNRLILGAGCGCHAKYDRDWETASTMKIWPIVVARFIILYPLMDASEHKNIPEILRKFIP